MLQKLMIGLIVIALLINDAIAFMKLKGALAWFLGDLAPLAALSVLGLAVAITAALFLGELAPALVRRLHLLGAYLYLTIGLAMFATGVEHGRDHFPADVAQDAFHLSQPTAVTVGSIITGVALSGVTFVFWNVLGHLIQQRARQRDAVAWEGKARAHGLPTDNILDLTERERAAR